MVEDILDSGMTLSYIREMLQPGTPGASSCAPCLINRSAAPWTSRQIIRHNVPDDFIVGYGLDYDEKYRNLPFVGILKPEVYGG